MRWILLGPAALMVLFVSCLSCAAYMHGRSSDDGLPPALHEGWYRLDCRKQGSGAMQCLYIKGEPGKGSFCVREVELAAGADVNDTAAWTFNLGVCGVKFSLRGALSPAPTL